MQNFLRRFFRKHIQSRIQNSARKREIARYRGTGVICLICGEEFRCFAPFGSNNRPNAKCPNCGSLERHRLLYHYLRESTDLFDAGREQSLLHFAPETMFQKVFREQSSLKYFPCDLHPAKYGEDVIKADITAIPFEDNTMDVVLSSHVLEHIPDDRKAMAELFRVMKPGGWGVLQVPVDLSRKTTYEDPSITSPRARKKAYGRKDHVRWYGRDYSERLAQAGFVVHEDARAASLSEEELFRYGFLRSEVIYYCEKTVIRQVE